MEGCSGKEAAALGALELLSSMDYEVLGVGTGSTVGWFIRRGEDLLRGRQVIASSMDTVLKLSRIGARILDPASGVRPDVYIDGADEATLGGDLVKGGGGALLGEKVLAYNSRVNIFIVDESKLVEVLGSRRPIPVEVLGQALRYVMDRISGMGYRVEARTSGGKAGPVVSDWGGFIIDVYTGGLKDPSLFERRVKSIPGVIETGVFIGLTDYLVIGRDGCRWEVLGVGRR